MDLSKRYGELSPAARLWLWNFAFWTFFGLVTFVFFTLRFSRLLPWYTDLAFQMFFWYAHALSVIVIFYLWRRFPVKSPHILSRFFLHCLFSLIFILTFAFFRIFYDWIHPAHPLGTTSVTGIQAKLFTVLGSISVMFFDYWAFLGGVLAVDNYLKYREREKEAAALQLRASQLETRLAVARLQALRMQLNPHFLFNTLHSISALVREDNKQAAIRMIAGLGDLLRHSLQNSESNSVSFKEELEFIEKYLEIEQQRFQDRLKIRLMVDPETYSAEVPSLILQPLVENAIRHGISKSSSASLIEIRSLLQNGKLVMQVRDDGPGLLRDAAVFDEGIGLHNTQKRLEGFYSSDFQFSLENADGGGVLATIVIPFTKISGKELKESEQKLRQMKS